ncbi:hypothetical protein EZS27_012687, partial [termite gut metagenome]
MMHSNNVCRVRLGDYIKPFKMKCGDSSAIVSGVDINKQFISTRANLDNVDVSKYYLVPPQYFACNLMHIGRDERLPIALNKSSENLIVTSAYFVFSIRENKKKELLEEYLYGFFNSSEIDRLVWFYTDSSIRGNLKESRFLDIEIPLPSIDKQREMVAVWTSLREMKEENERIAEPLESLCRSYLQDLKYKYPLIPIGSYIEPCDERNSNLMYSVDNVRGISINKSIIDTKADMNGVSLTPYKLFKSNQFCFVTVTSRNGEKITIAINDSKSTYMVSSSYCVFKV